jgi:16S rRNA (cytidine1402-2'-O)-methyltransferase
MANRIKRMPPQNNTGALYVVATPIGNLEDMSPRVIKTLAEVDLIACEDTRHTKTLCNAFNISTPLCSYYREKEQEKSEILVNLLKSGKKIALVSDAGTPAICDPGAILVNKARSAGIKIIAIAGPSALTASLSIAGLADSKFFFGGFLPANTTERKKFLRSISALPFALIFYETPHRIHASLADMADILGDRQAKLFRELSKIHEECIDGTLVSLHEQILDGVKGELVLMVEGASPPQKEKPEHIEGLLLWYRDELRTSLKDAVHSIATELNLPRSHVYKLALALWNTSDDDSASHN